MANKLTKDQKRKKKLKAKKSKALTSSKLPLDNAVPLITSTVNDLPQLDSEPSEELNSFLKFLDKDIAVLPYKEIYENYKKVDLNDSHKFLQSIADEYDFDFDPENVLEEFVDEFLLDENLPQDFIQVLQSAYLKWSEIIDDIRARGYIEQAEKMLYINRCIHEDLLVFKSYEESKDDLESY